MNKELHFLSSLTKATSRRRFLKWSGITIGVTALTSACGSDDDDDDDDNNNGSDYVKKSPGDLGIGDFGILNYAYALEQLEAAFYTQVVATPYRNISPAELSILTDIRDHEVIHRDFFKSALGSQAIVDLQVDFSSIDFTSRNSVLNAARTFEDLGVGAYNGAGRLIESSDYITLAGKIVSVEARHASVIRDLIAPKSAAFAGDDIVDPATGLDNALPTSTVLAAADSFVVTPIDGSGLPS